MHGLSVSQVLLALAALTQGKIVPYTLNVANRNVSLDGFKRSAITLNGLTPGPILTATKGDDLRVTVNNRLNDHTMRVSTTVHWHGIVRNTPQQHIVALFSHRFYSCNPVRPTMMALPL